MGKQKTGKIGSYGTVKADAFVQGTLEGAASSKADKVAGKGFSIGGPVGDRKILARRLPQYPAWAEEQGITALIKIYFTVDPDGRVRANLRVLSSSGYAELDQLAKDAIRQWHFAPSRRSSTDTAWGVITFRFTLA